MKKTAAFIYANNKFFYELAKIAKASFESFNKDIDCYIIYEPYDNDEVSASFKKFHCSFSLARSLGVEKVICLGADTITCSRLSEFLDDDTTDILATLDYPRIINLGFKNSNEQNHVNADVVCFNNLGYLREIINLLHNYPQKFITYSLGVDSTHLDKKEILIRFFKENFSEQGALNCLLFSGEYDPSFKIVDSPYPDSKVAYNCRGKGNINSSNPEDYKPYISKYKVIDNQLFTHDDCNIKVFHYCAGLGSQGTLLESEKLLNKYLSFFNDDTKDFFRKNIKTNFFDKELHLTHK